MQVEALHSEDMAQVQERYRALDLPVGQLDDHKWVMQLAPETYKTSLSHPIKQYQRAVLYSFVLFCTHI